MVEEKAFKPSKRRLERAKRDGRFAKSSIITQGSVLTAVLAGAAIFWHGIWVKERLLINYCLAQGSEHPLFCFESSFRAVLVICFGALLIGAVVGVLVEIAQVGFSVNPSLLKVKFDRLNPAAGVGKIFDGLRQIWRPLTFLVISVALLGRALVDAPIKLARAVVYDAGSSIVVGQSVLFQVTLIGAACLGVAGSVDYLLSRRKLRRELSMSADDLRREFKEDEGDPHVRATRRAMHEQLLMQDLVRRVRQAKVIVVERSE